MNGELPDVLSFEITPLDFDDARPRSPRDCPSARAIKRVYGVYPIVGWLNVYIYQDRDHYVASMINRGVPYLQTYEITDELKKFISTYDDGGVVGENLKFQLRKQKV